MSATDTSSVAQVERQGAQAPAEAAATSGRAVSQLLDELGSALDLAFAEQRRPFRLGHACAVAAVLLAVAAGVVALVLARQTAPRALRAIPAVEGLVARGSSDGVAWALAVNACPSPKGGYALSLFTGEGSSTTPCAGAARPASTFYDQAANVALVFGTAPAGTARVAVAGSGGGSSTGVIVRQVSPAFGAGVSFVGEIPFAQTATALTAYGVGSRLLEACSEQRCVTP